MGRVLKAASQRPGFNPLGSILTPSLGFIYTVDREWLGWAGLGWAILEWKRAPRESEVGFFSREGSVEISPRLRRPPRVSRVKLRLEVCILSRASHLSETPRSGPGSRGLAVPSPRAHPRHAP